MALNGRVIAAGVAALAVALWAASAAAQNGATLPNVKVVVTQAASTDSTDGAVLYDAYCASCHGKDLKGFGPAWRFNHLPPTDLTRCAAGHTTQESRALHIAQSLRDGHPAVTAQDGRKLDMPNWAMNFRSMSSPRNDATDALRIANLASFIASRQVNPVASLQAAKWTDK